MPSKTPWNSLVIYLSRIQQSPTASKLVSLKSEGCSLSYGEDSSQKRGSEEVQGED